MPASGPSFRAGLAAFIGGQSMPATHRCHVEAFRGSEVQSSNDSNVVIPIFALANSWPLSSTPWSPRAEHANAAKTVGLVRAFAIFGMAAALLTLSGAGFAQDYPNRPIRIVVPTQPGAAQDIIVRLLQPYLEKSLGAADRGRQPRRRRAP